MSGVRQTAFGDEGNCLRAAVATITGIPLADVVDVLDGARPEAEWYDRLEQWAGEHGWLTDPRAPDEPPPGLSIASGVTTRGPQTHAIVAKDGCAWWDPHPSDAYIVSVDYYIAFEPTHPASNARLEGIER
jgi:hypothetical protein